MSQVAPADLNAFIYMLERNIAWMANQTGNATASNEFKELASSRKDAMEQVLWNPSTCEWEFGVGWDLGFSITWGLGYILCITPPGLRCGPMALLLGHVMRCNRVLSVVWEWWCNGDVGQDVVRDHMCSFWVSSVEGGG